MTVTKKAPPGQFRVIGKDDPRDQGWLKNDYPNAQQAKQAAKNDERSFIRFQVFNDQGECIHGGSRC